MSSFAIESLLEEKISSVKIIKKEKLKKILEKISSANHWTVIENNESHLCFLSADSILYAHVFEKKRPLTPVKVILIQGALMFETEFLLKNRVKNEFEKYFESKKKTLLSAAGIKYYQRN